MKAAIQQTSDLKKYIVITDDGQEFIVKDINEAIKFWQNMSQDKDGGSDFFSTHPSSQNRTKDIQTVINKINSEAK